MLKIIIIGNDNFMIDIIKECYGLNYRFLLFLNHKFLIQY